MFGARRNNEFSLAQKTNIFIKQCYKQIQNINIQYWENHIQHFYNTPNFKNMPICPYCLNCYLFPGEMVNNELRKKNYIIETPPDLFGTKWIRPAECDHIRSYLHGGTNSDDNAIFCCSDCNKNKSYLDARQFLQNAFIYDACLRKYTKKTEKELIEYMDGDFNNICYHCNKTFQISNLPKLRWHHRKIKTYCLAYN